MEKKQLVLTSRKLFSLVTRPSMPQDFDHLLNTKTNRGGEDLGWCTDPRWLVYNSPEYLNRGGKKLVMHSKQGASTVVVMISYFPILDDAVYR